MPYVASSTDWFWVHAMDSFLFRSLGYGHRSNQLKQWSCDLCVQVYAQVIASGCRSLNTKTACLPPCDFHSHQGLMRLSLHKLFHCRFGTGLMCFKIIVLRRYANYKTLCKFDNSDNTMLISATRRRRYRLWL
jgi:hypothetical protein